MIIRNADQQSRARDVPFDGMEIPATPIATYLRGIEIMREGVVAGRPSGQFLMPD